MFLDDLRLFLRIVEKGGMAAAGRDLGMSRAKVSERVVALEAYYGARLLTRTTRSVTLTDEGRELMGGARRILAEAEETHTRIRHGNEALIGVIRISAPSDLGRNRLGPMLEDFQKLHPGVCIDVMFTDGRVDLVAGGFDLAVRLGSLPDSTMRARALGKNRRVVCAAPAYLEKHGKPRHPKDLEKHNCIVMRFGEDIDNRWAFLVDGKITEFLVAGNWVVNDGGYAKSLARAGHGLVLKSNWDVAADLASGALVPVLKRFMLPASTLQIVYADGAIQPRRVRALIDYLVAGFAPTGQKK